MAKNFKKLNNLSLLSLPEAKFVEHKPHPRSSHSFSAIQPRPSGAPQNDGKSQQSKQNRMERGETAQTRGRDDTQQS